mmetsp:Transcript_8785/g.26116  ORF Transcript_8785/g.26116 Transcript_8785/m.26116 type:complete len:292 (+) Transcript_8785:277-1152(+)
MRRISSAAGRAYGRQAGPRGRRLSRLDDARARFGAAARGRGSGARAEWRLLLDGAAVLGQGGRRRQDRLAARPRVGEHATPAGGGWRRLVRPRLHRCQQGGLRRLLRACPRASPQRRRGRRRQHALGRQGARGARSDGRHGRDPGDQRQARLRPAREHRHARHRGRGHALPKAVTGFARGWCRCSRATVYVLVRRRHARAARASAATDGPALRRYDGRTTAARVRAAVFVRSEKSNALVGDGVLQPAPRSANLDSAFGGMQLFATEAWRAAPLLLTRSAQLAQPTVRLPQL